MDFIRQAIERYLESCYQAGLEVLPHPSPAARERVSRLAANEAQSDAPPDAAPAVSKTAADGAPPESDPPVLQTPEETAAAAADTRPEGLSQGLSTAERQVQLETIRQEVQACTLCADLCTSRTQTVFGVGPVAPRLCFMGEAPGADEDRTGEPFVGAAGKLLNRIIEASGMRREDVFILNTLKCRPPGNRNPTPVEAANCRSFLDRQLEVLRPEFICCLGAVAAQNLLNTSTPLGRLRGRLHQYRGIQVMATYHPAYLLRNPDAKKLTWEDMQFLLREMGLPVPSPGRR